MYLYISRSAQPPKPILNRASTIFGASGTSIVNYRKITGFFGHEQTQSQTEHCSRRWKQKTRRRMLKSVDYWVLGYVIQNSYEMKSNSTLQEQSKRLSRHLTDQGRTEGRSLGNRNPSLLEAKAKQCYVADIVRHLSRDNIRSGSNQNSNQILKKNQQVAFLKQ